MKFVNQLPMTGVGKVDKKTLRAKFWGTRSPCRVAPGRRQDERPTEEESRREIETILRRRKENWIRLPDDPDQRWDASTRAEWESWIRISSESTKNSDLPRQIGEPAAVFTNELIDEINDFDKAAVVRQAVDFKL
ncbi:hypothetical protein QA640_35440 [Bradyrhizobium sp. CB82]|uniref:hypothetical protein n=1 Tax=Bradyrhizobium sp. CB82 TaxID=3039159 RepID=UPI0024B0E349|nr:hypothetical protein [Bradyrhizobium sp. CB82]WFU39602.1 hypothetical protein QA640_35440 [Bradyrhizobium sp. CB82]